MPETPPKSYWLHECATRWLPLVPGLRTVFLSALGFVLLAVIVAGLAPVVTRVVAIQDDATLAAAIGSLSDVIQSLSVFGSVLVLLYPLSKAASGLRDRWTGGYAGAGDALSPPPADSADSLEGLPDEVLEGSMGGVIDSPDALPCSCGIHDRGGRCDGSCARQ